MMIQNRHDDRMKWYKLTGIGASRNVELVQRQPPKLARFNTVAVQQEKINLVGFEPTTSAMLVSRHFLIVKIAVNNFHPIHKY